MKETINKSGIYPCGNRILVLPEVVEKETDWGFQFTDNLVDQVGQAQIAARLIAVGVEAWEDSLQPFAKVGDRVVFAKYQGLRLHGHDGQEYRVMNDRDITCLIDEDLNINDELDPRKVNNLQAKKEA